MEASQLFLKTSHHGERFPTQREQEVILISTVNFQVVFDKRKEFDEVVG